MLRKPLLAGAAMTLLAGGAQASDSGYDWSGFYIGGHAGYNWSEVDWSWEVPVLFTEQDVSSRGSGFGGGVQAGVQKQWGSFVAGLEFSYDWLAGQDDEVIDFLFLPRKIETDVDDLMMIDLRLGWAHDRFLGFIKGGYARATIDLDTFRAEDDEHQSTSSGREDGVNIGAGLEFAVTDNIIVGADYTYVRLFGDDREDANTAIAAPSDHSDLDVDIHMVNGRVSFKFGNFAPLP